MGSFRTPLARAHGLGSAKRGVEHWIGERITSIALVPLILWAVYSGLTLAAADYAGAVAWLQSPVNAVLTTLLIVVGFWHMHAGLRVVIEDYVEHGLPRSGALIANLFICALGAGLAIFSVLKVAIVGGAY